MSLGNSIRLATERIVEPVEGMHRAIASPWFTALGALGRPVHVAHSLISCAVYGSIRLGGAAVGAGLDERVSADSSSSAAAVEALLNGLWGDDLGRQGIGGASMSLRDREGGRIQPLDSELAVAFPAATGRLVVLVHGLVMTERCWHSTDAKPGLLRSLEDHGDATPVAVRYNSGLPVATNGSHLAALLEEVHAHWPTPVRSIALVGHSMGGLVVRSACEAALHAGHRWVEDLEDVVTIGSPHRGAPLEKLVTAAARGLGVARQTRPLADFLERRSQGIKDLRLGSIGLAPEAAPLLADVRYHLVAGVVTTDPAHPFGAVVGDLMVRPASGTTAPTLDPATAVVLGGTHHFGLLHDSAVIDHVMRWVSPSRDR